MTLNITNCLYLLTSNANALYLQDAVNCIGMPQGSTMHFRYESKYVSSNVLTQPIQTGQRIIICLVNRHAIDAGSSDSKEILYPIRHGSLTSFKNSEGICHFWFRLENHIQTQTATAYTNLVEYIMQQIGGKLDITSPLCIISRYLYTLESPGEDSFRVTIDAISKSCIDAEKIAFMRFEGIQKIEKNDTALLIKESARSGIAELPPISRYELEYNSTYALTLSWYNSVVPKDDGGEPLLADFEVNSDYFDIYGTSQLVLNGRYDTAVIYLVTKKQNDDISTFLKIIVISKNGSNVQSVKNRRVVGIKVVFPVFILSDQRRVVMMRRLLAGSDVSLLLGAAIFTLAGVFSKFVTIQNNQLPSLIVNCLIIAGALTLIGALLKGIVNYNKEQT